MRKLIPFVMFCLFGACRQAEMETYRVAKETPPSMAMGDAGSESHPMGDHPSGEHPAGDHSMIELPPGHPEIGENMSGAAAAGIVPETVPQGRVRWTTPKVWTEKPGSGFRYASFVVPGRQGLAGDLSIIMLKGSAGGLLSNVNRWRGQIGLGPLAEGDLASQSREIRPAGRLMTLVSYASPDKRIDGKYRQRLMAAVYSSPENTWFFKLVGEDDLVRSAEPDFLKFLESLKGL